MRPILMPPPRFLGTGRAMPRLARALRATSSCALRSSSCCARISVAVACWPCFFFSSMASLRACAMVAISTACCARSSSSFARSSSSAIISVLIISRRRSASVSVSLRRDRARSSASADSSAYLMDQDPSLDLISASRLFRSSSSLARFTARSVSSRWASSFASLSFSCSDASRWR